MQTAGVKPWLWLPASWAHTLSPLALRWLNHFGNGQPLVWKSLKWQNLVFKNPLGVAGGLDKNGEFLKAWWNLGAGFVEIGTVTPEPQGPNDGVIISRSKKAQALWNRMGFPSHGMDDVYFNLNGFRPYATPVFVNVGKNRLTSLEDAPLDYLAVMQRLHPVADVFVINISSPNTPGLRDLQKKENLIRLFQPLVQFCQTLDHKPLLVKLSPDLTSEELAETVGAAIEVGVNGFVLTNTTLSRPKEVSFPKEGGLSGKPLKSRSEEVLTETLRLLGSQRPGKLIVSVGGVFSAEDVLRRLKMGADLVQAYSAVVFEGPNFFKQVSDEFQKRPE
jgi:dihydroorotate dehydrogenase